MDNSSRYGVYWGKDILKDDGKSKEAIIDSILWEDDTIFIVGKEKTGKSILGLQMACMLTTGEDFLDSFKIKRPYEVLYIQTEGKRYDTVERLSNMMTGMRCNLDKLTHVFLPCIGLDTKAGIDMLHRMIERNKRKPEVVFIDPLYMSMEGDMKDAKASRAWIGNVREFVGAYNAALVVVHHTHRGRRNESGESIFEGDDAIYGSFVWKAFPDHVFLFQRKGKMHFLSCTTQRSAKVIERIDCVLHQPRPLLFTMEDSDVGNNCIKINAFIDNKGSVSAEDIIKGLNLGRATVYRGLRRLLNNNTIDKNDKTVPVLYMKKNI